MKLFIYEIKKLLFTEKGMVVTFAALALTVIAALVIPEQRDKRIVNAHKVYDELMILYHGPDSAWKQQEVRERQENIQNILSMYDEKYRTYRAGHLSDEEWDQYKALYNQAASEEAAVDIFFSKAVSFSFVEDKFIPSYIDDYGWNTVFLFLGFPSVFSLLAIIYLASRSVSIETENGMLSVLYASYYGRRELVLAKLSSVMVIAAVLAVMTVFSEMLIFILRGFFSDSNVISASIQWFYEAESVKSSPLIISLMMTEMLRTTGLVLCAVLTYSLSVLLKSGRSAILIMLMILTSSSVLYLSGNNLALSGLSGLLCGSRLLQNNTAACFLQPVSCIFVVAVLTLLSITKFSSSKGELYKQRKYINGSSSRYH